ncbi:MAG: RHS repeat-associated core domain-containing protein [Chloroflexota bacterium]|nr:RHS repeat-associated core domain-containing protein [Chloroflexota bacterium]
MGASKPPKECNTFGGFSFGTPSNGHPLATRVGGTLYYIHSDHLGSTSLATDANGTEVTGSRTLYYPYGEIRYTTGVLSTDFGFTGQRNEGTIGLYDYCARYYAPVLGRFISADTIVPGNPLRYVDPSGYGNEPFGGVGAREEDDPSPPPPIVPVPVPTPPTVVPTGTPTPTPKGTQGTDWRPNFPGIGGAIPLLQINPLSIDLWTKRYEFEYELKITGGQKDRWLEIEPDETEIGPIEWSSEEEMRVAVLPMKICWGLIQSEGTYKFGVSPPNFSSTGWSLDYEMKNELVDGDFSIGTEQTMRMKVEYRPKREVMVAVVVTGLVLLFGPQGLVAIPAVAGAAP